MKNNIIISHELSNQHSSMACLMSMWRMDRMTLSQEVITSDPNRSMQGCHGKVNSYIITTYQQAIRSIRFCHRNFINKYETLIIIIIIIYYLVKIKPNNKVIKIKHQNNTKVITYYVKICKCQRPITTHLGEMSKVWGGDHWWLVEEFRDE